MTTALASPSTGRAEFLAELIERGLIIDSGVPGTYGHNEVFEDIRTGLEHLLTREAVSRGARRLRFPPLLPRRHFEQSGYLASFPHLAGTIYAFDGDEAQAEAQNERACCHGDWSEFQRMTDLTLLPAACYPVYPAIAARGHVAPGGVFIEAGGTWVFRHEPSEDPARRQIFRQHELVRIGEPEAVLEWRDAWAQHGLELLRGLELPTELQNANDPFFGRAGRMLAVSQREQALKLELVVPIAGSEPTAVASFNHHREHFGAAFGIELSDGSTAHTACAGFGHERIVLALLRTHGLEPAGWPPELRERLGLR